MQELESAIAEYKAALEANMNLSRQEAIISKNRIAARSRLNMAKDELRALEMDNLSAVIVEN